MNKKQLLKNITELDIYKEIQEEILIEARKIVDSGAVNYSEEEENSYALAKAIISAIFLKLHRSTYPLSKDYQEVTDNLKHF